MAKVDGPNGSGSPRTPKNRKSAGTIAIHRRKLSTRVYAMQTADGATLRTALVSTRFLWRHQGCDSLSFPNFLLCLVLRHAVQPPSQLHLPNRRLLILLSKAGPPT